MKVKIITPVLNIATSIIQPTTIIIIIGNKKHIVSLNKTPIQYDIFLVPFKNI